jgi:hypothetical protein
MMAPPKVNTPIQTAQKTGSSHRSLQETTDAEQEFTQTEGIIDVNVIPSPQVEPVSATLVEEEGKAPTMVRMDIDLHNNVQIHDLLAIGNPQQPSRA